MHRLQQCNQLRGRHRRRPPRSQSYNDVYNELHEDHDTVHANGHHDGSADEEWPDGFQSPRSPRSGEYFDEMN